MRKVLIIGVMMTAFALCVASATGQSRKKKTVEPAEVQVVDTVVVEVKKTKTQIADSLYACYNEMLSKKFSCDSVKLYKTLNACFEAYLRAIEDTTETSFLSSKDRIRKLHPKLQEGGTYFSIKKNAPMAMELLENYVMLPKHKAFNDEIFSFPRNVSQLIFFVANNKYNSREFPVAIELFNDYLNANGNKSYECSAYLYLSKCYEYTGSDSYRIYTLMKAIEKYPTDARFYKEITDYHLDRQDINQAKLYLSVYEKLDADKLDLLELKAKVAEMEGEYYACMLLSGQLNAADSNNINRSVLYGRACYNYVVEEMKKGKTDVNGNPTTELKLQLENAARMFEFAMSKKPKDKQYYDALIDTYSLLGEKEKAIDVAEKLKVLLGYKDVPLVAVNDSTAINNVEAKNDSVAAGQAMQATVATSTTDVVTPATPTETPQITKKQRAPITSYGVPVFSSYARDFVTGRLNVWLQKDAFETTADYKERTTGVSRAKKEREFINEAKKRYINKYKYAVASQVGDIRLIDYDADNETFLIKYSLGNMLVRVPMKDDQARKFKAAWISNQVKPANDIYDIVGDSIMLTGLTFAMKETGASYEYSRNNQLSYVKANMRIDPTPITSFEIGQSTVKSKPGAVIIETEVGGETIDDGKKSDVDIDIPVIADSLRNENMYALIISNENYDNADKVAYAINDGASMYKYCVNVLGIPNKNIESQVDVSYGKMLKMIEDFATTLREAGPEAKGIVYYSGHGGPNVETNEAFFLPKDGIPESGQYTVPMNMLYNLLGETGAKQISIFLDCCFSGNSKTTGHHLYAARGIVIKPKENEPKGNMIVLTACSGNETAFCYNDQRHGLFTYYLLKKLKETSGNVTFGELAEFVESNVHSKSWLNNKKYQTPNVSMSNDLSVTWRDMKVR